MIYFKATNISNINNHLIKLIAHIYINKLIHPNMSKKP